MSITKKKNRNIKIIARTSTIFSVIGMMLTVFQLAPTTMIPISIVLALVSLGLSFMIEYAPDTLEKFIQTIKSVDNDVLSEKDLEALYLLRLELQTIITSTEASHTIQSQPFTQMTHAENQYP